VENKLDSAEIQAKKGLIGAQLESADRLNLDWDFRFGAGSSLMFQSLWRLVSDTGIEVTSEDDGQQFGLKTPVSATDELRHKVGQSLITDVQIDGATSDLTIHFGQGLRLEVISTSSGYEAWSLHAKHVHIIGRNGDTVIFPPPSSI
jgi:hypothetical protein